MAFQSDAFQTNAFQIQKLRITATLTMLGAGTIKRNLEMNTKYSQDATVHPKPTLTLFVR